MVMLLHKNIRLLRKHFDLLQIDLAVELDISQSYYSRLELGKAKSVPVFIIEKIADYYSISMDTLLKRDLEKEPHLIPRINRIKL